MKVRCRVTPAQWPARPHDLIRMKFKCSQCEQWICGECEGGHTPDDPASDRLCDDCWRLTHPAESPLVPIQTLTAKLKAKEEVGKEPKPYEATHISQGCLWRLGGRTHGSFGLACGLLGDASPDHLMVGPGFIVHYRRGVGRQVLPVPIEAVRLLCSTCAVAKDAALEGREWRVPTASGSADPRRRPPSPPSSQRAGRPRKPIRKRGGS